MTAEKRVKIAYILTFAVLLVQIIDVFFFHSQNSVLASNVISRIVGISAVIIVSKLVGINLKGFCFKSYGAFFEVFYGAVFALVPIILVYIAKYYFFRYRDYDNLALTFRPSNFPDNDIEKNLNLLIIYILTILFIAVFKEVFYRGFLITQLSTKYGIYKAVFIQSVFYVAAVLPTLVYYIITGKFDSQGPVMTVFLICGHLFFNFLSAIKWGMFYKVNGTVWMSIADHFISNFVVSSFFFTDSRLPEKWYIIEVVAIQLLSVLLFIPFYMHRDRINENAAQEFALNKESLKMGVDNYAPSAIRKRADSFYNRRDNFYDGQQLTNSIDNSDELVSFNSKQLLTEDDLMMSVRGYAINDVGFEYKTEVSAHDSDPTGRAQAYFDSILGKEVEDEVPSDVKSNDDSNASNISELVKNYFDENFEKHTFVKK